MTRLYRELFGAETPRCIAVVGAGGKTSCIGHLAEELAAAGHRVVVTTTTKMRAPADESAFAHSAAQAADMLARTPVVCAGVRYGEGKMNGLAGELPGLLAAADYVLVEADGARHHSLKMIDPTHEPVVPPEADAVLAVAGMSAIGGTVEEAVHRPALACAALGVGPEHLVTPADAAALLRLCYAPRFVLLNQADSPERRAFAAEIVRLLPEARCTVAALPLRK